ncbi:hypothetical protein VZT92_016986 [Zoarces viviparus]|uniref:Uncharacterized protein n=1 Tax=Zoarces viviparus TaxID=48416 RepID=A0AAW1EQ82_ZOAVI
MWSFTLIKLDGLTRFTGYRFDVDLFGVVNSRPLGPLQVMQCEVISCLDRVLPVRSCWFGDAVQLVSVGNSRDALNCCRVLLGLLPAASGVYDSGQTLDSSVVSCCRKFPKGSRNTSEDMFTYS